MQSAGESKVEPRDASSPDSSVRKVSLAHAIDIPATRRSHIGKIPVPADPQTWRGFPDGLCHGHIHCRAERTGPLCWRTRPHCTQPNSQRHGDAHRQPCSARPLGWTPCTRAMRMGMAMTGSPTKVPAHCDHIGLFKGLAWRDGVHQSCNRASAQKRETLHCPAAASNGDTWSAGDRPGDSRSKKGGRRVGWAALRPNHSSKRDSPTGPIMHRCNVTPVPRIPLLPWHWRADWPLVAVAFKRWRVMDCYSLRRSWCRGFLLGSADTAAESEEDRSTGSGRSAGVVHDSLSTGNAGRAWQNAAKLATKGRCASQYLICKHAACRRPDVRK